MNTRRAARQAVTQATPVAQTGVVRVRVRVRPGGPERRYRAGLGPFGQNWTELSVQDGDVLAALRADHMLEVLEA